ncbi:MAG TPA: hypothetical protein VIY73_12950, partial [Polyangiaceae bacterium]
MGRRVVKFLCWVPLVVGLLLVSGAAHAEVWQEPVGGKAVALPEGRVACPGTTGDWTIEQDGHAVRPSAADDAVGHAVEAKLAPNAASCTTTASTLTLLATG